MSNDLRQGGTWTPLQRAKNDALWVLAMLTVAATRPLSFRALRLLGRALGAVAHALAPRARQTALRNVGLVFPELDERQRGEFVRRCFRAVGEHVGETAALLHSSKAPPQIPLSRSAHVLLERARGEGRGVVFASAHLGPWERVAASLVAAGVPLVTLARESYDPRFSRLYDRLRSAHGVGVIWRAKQGAAARIVRTLRGGGVLGIPMDLRSRVTSLDAPFLGHDAPTAAGPARIALRTGAAVVVGTAAPDGMSPARPGRGQNLDGTSPARPGRGQNLEDGALVVTATRIPTHDLPPGQSAVLELTSRINRELSHRILALPHAWVWMHERWGESAGSSEARDRTINLGSAGSL